MPFVHSFTKIIWHDVAKKTKPKILGRLKAIAQSYHLNFASSVSANFFFIYKKVIFFYY